MSEKSWPDYRAVWRWHFYAGLLCIPFVIVLSISGLIYLFKPQIKAWNDRHYDNLQLSGHAKPASEQIAAAIVSLPGSTFSSYKLPESSTSSAQVVAKHEDAHAALLWPRSPAVEKGITFLYDAAQTAQGPIL